MRLSIGAEPLYMNVECLECGPPAAGPARPGGGRAAGGVSEFFLTAVGAGPRDQLRVSPPGPYEKGTKGCTVRLTLPDPSGVGWWERPGGPGRP